MTRKTAVLLGACLSFTSATLTAQASDCTPTTTVLQFDGRYEVSMCYRTPQGDEGHARSGIWASGQSGLLWFFSRDNAEVLVKRGRGFSAGACEVYASGRTSSVRSAHAVAGTSLELLEI